MALEQLAKRSERDSVCHEGQKPGRQYSRIPLQKRGLSGQRADDVAPVDLRMLTYKNYSHAIFTVVFVFISMDVKGGCFCMGGVHLRNASICII